MLGWRVDASRFQWQAKGREYPMDKETTTWNKSQIQTPAQDSVSPASGNLSDHERKGDVRCYSAVLSPVIFFW